MMLVMHGIAIPSLIATTRSAHGLPELLGPMIRLAGLSASAAFFVLKIIDVPCLRLNTDWRSIVCVVLIIGLMHVGVIDRALGGDLSTDGAHIGFVVFAGLVRWRAAIKWAMCHILGLLLAIRLLRHRTDGQTFGSGLTLTRVDAIIARLSQTFLPSFSGPRAPPIS
ncbi:MAG: hypothetical protein DHS20C16_28340 [Phycisphaerae bacterium]|nr:MAG: hypothetical protein DHS20C16_28340 [Phycisphaerae bacterium]